MIGIEYNQLKLEFALKNLFCHIETELFNGDFDITSENWIPVMVKKPRVLMIGKKSVYSVPIQNTTELETSLNILQRFSYLKEYKSILSKCL